MLLPSSNMGPGSLQHHNGGLSPLLQDIPRWPSGSSAEYKHFLVEFVPKREQRPWSSQKLKGRSQEIGLTVTQFMPLAAFWDEEKAIWLSGRWR